MWPMCGVWDPAFVYRPISRPITFSFLVTYNSRSYPARQPRSSPTNYNRGRVTVNRVEHRALGLAVACTVTVLAQLISDTWVPSWGPLLTSCGLVQRHRSPHNRMPRVPLALPVASYLSPPFAFTRLVPAPRTAAPRGRAPSATRMRSAAQMARPLGAMHSRTVTDSGSQQGPSLLRPWNLLPCRSPP